MFAHAPPMHRAQPNPANPYANPNQNVPKIKAVTSYIPRVITSHHQRPEGPSGPEEPGAPSSPTRSGGAAEVKVGLERSETVLSKTSILTLTQPASKVA
jgi:hypothetical protein